MSIDGPSFYASPAEATRAPAEEFLYVACLHEGTGVDEPDFLAVVDAEDGSIVHRLPMPNAGHCMPGENIVISMLGDAEGNGACGFAVIDAKTFEVKGRWENGGPHPPFNYDFWYQPRKNVLASSEFGEPNAYGGGFDLDDVGKGRCGSRLHFWDLGERTLQQTVELGETGLVPLEMRWLHDPDADEGFVGTALSSTMWHFHRDNGSYRADTVIAVEGVEQEGWPFPVPGLITDLVVSMDDRFLYFSNWLHGDLRQYDISDPAHPRLTGRL